MPSLGLMPGRQFWILAASLGLTLSALAADQAPATSKVLGAVPNIEGDNLGFEENGKVFVATNARLESQGAVLTAQKIRVDYVSGLITAEGNVVYSTPNLRILGERVTVDPKTDTITAHNVRFGRSPTYFTADELKIVKGDKSMRGVRMWRNEPSPMGMHLGIQEATYTEKDDWLALRKVTPHFLGVPFMMFPYYGQEGYRDIPYDVYLAMGRQDNQGFYFRSTVLARQTPSLWLGGLLDYYSKSGILVGPAIRFDNSKQPADGTVWKGRFQGGYIHDNGDIVTDDYGRLPGRNRHFEIGEVNGRTKDGVEIAGQIFGQSDPESLRDFRRNLVERVGLPQATLEVSSFTGDGYLSANVAAKVDDYQDVVQRLPEVRFDLPQTALGDAGILQRSFVTLSYLTERPSEQLPLPVFTTVTGSNTAWSTGRLDTYYGLSRPFVLSDWLTFRPVAGVRATGWSSGLNDSGSASKVIGQAGFDLEGLATGSWELVARKWDINGLRHSIRPLFQYRVMPGADREIGVVPMSERAVALSAMEEVDLADRLDAASTTDTEVMRFGIRNTLETRDAKYGTRELLRADLFTDWRKGPTDAETGRTDLNAHIRLTPAPWVTVDSVVRLPNGGGAALESIQTLAFNSGDFWKTSFSWAELREITPTRQLIWGGQVTLNSVYSAVANINYDSLTGRIVHEKIGLIQRIGNSWELEYSIQKTRSDLGDSSLGFHIRAHLFKF